MTANEQVELEILKANLAAGTCVGQPASEEQQEIRRIRIARLEREG